ncbi:hypothetical protein PanWU01x14_038000 [Parasponia andersonii]|uniref:Uncharacterized protein n=1 Tax=Parasponia andersonii TaxID=3476 RepID=A0A2P5DS22_PARAD|nr:hypothetical protein PanWU01x14_038000 [Parasponia andersonii]
MEDYNHEDPPLAKTPSEKNRETTIKQRMLKEYINPVSTQPKFCIKNFQLDVAFELKSRMIKLLPKFHGHPNEDSHRHLSDFRVAYLSMKLARVTKEQVRLRAFPLSHIKWLY